MKMCKRCGERPAKVETDKTRKIITKNRDKDNMTNDISFGVKDSGHELCYFCYKLIEGYFDWKYPLDQNRAKNKGMFKGFKNIEKIKLQTLFENRS